MMTFIIIHYSFYISIDPLIMIMETPQFYFSLIYIFSLHVFYCLFHNV